MHRSKNFQGGTAAVEFSLTLMVFFLFIFGIIEMARVLYVMNTVQEVTRSAAHAAAKANFADSSAMEHIRQRAVFRADSGYLLLAEPITDAHVRIDYMALVRAGSLQVLTRVPTLPASPMMNRSTCIADPNDANCIRFVRVRICGPGTAGECNPVPYQTIVPLVPLTFNVPMATTIVTAESLGL
ncbi:pilus assembly protein TadE [Massilia eurypsychrophila]|uniref:Pilus assembly protein TadE n=1 Tax=Massilia eurypsychrophila TaxID=1485217 RepID=A0A2G8TBV9_9BURK|nr:TadE family protein [Massilia eurypsychrophila]PIL43512.1 pilus assembly protein TadE [Massilia eurypsychrophila]